MKDYSKPVKRLAALEGGQCHLQLRTVDARRAAMAANILSLSDVPAPLSPMKQLKQPVPDYAVLPPNWRCTLPDSFVFGFDCSKEPS